MNAFGDALVRAPPHPRNDVIRKTSADAAPQKHLGARENFFLSFLDFYWLALCTDMN